MADERDEPGEEREPTEGVQIVGDEEPALRFGPDDTGPLPHWTEPPTGEVPKILADEPHDDVDPWSSFSGQAPVWRDDQQEGTEAAGLFLADANNRQKLQEALGFSGSPTEPVYFETLIRTQAVAGAPNATSIVATRVINP